MTVLVRNTEGLKAKLRARTVKQKQRILTASGKEAEATFDLAQALCPRDTEWMATHMHLEYTRGGYNWWIGFLRGDFVGQTNNLANPPFIITAFYPKFVIEGTESRFRPGNDFLRAALELRRTQILGGFR